MRTVKLSVEVNARGCGALESRTFGSCAGDVETDVDGIRLEEPDGFNQRAMILQGDEG
jgi:hypothetical protein